MNKRCLDIPLSLLSQAPRTAREQIGSLSYEMLKQGDILLTQFSSWQIIKVLTDILKRPIRTTLQKNKMDR